MLSTILSSLQTLISPRFVISAFFPALAFWFSNAVMLFWVHEPFRHWTEALMTQTTVGQGALLIPAALIGVAISAYGLSAVMPAIQAVFEGSWLARFSRFFAVAQARQLRDLEDRIAQYRQLRGELERDVDGVPQTEVWERRLRDARMIGSRNARGINFYTLDADSAGVVSRLVRLHEQYERITAAQIEGAIAALEPDLRANDADQKNSAGQYTLEKVRQQLWDSIEYAIRHAQDKYRDLTNRRRFSFSKTTFAPTRMGNVAQTIQSYALERYDFNFELFWSRMQRVIQKDATFGPILQAAKTQLDFLIAFSALSAIWTATWLIVLASHRDTPLRFSAVSAGGLVASWLWYRAAVAHYRTFADVLRTSIDLFRFDLLNELHFPIPGGVLDERALWTTADRLQALYELQDLRYVPPKSNP